VPDDRSTSEQALDLLVYGPIGLAMYVRDTAPSFLRLFVARGRTVVGDQRKSAEGQLGQARSVGELASAYGGPQVLRLLGDGLSTARTRVEEVLATIGTLTGATPAAEPASGGAPGAAPGPAAAPSGSSTAAARLAIRDYETSHRARNTVLGKIEQLTRPAD
jgi:hypothetical protein